MNRKYFGYTGFAMFIAICICISSSAPVDAQRVRCGIGALFCERGGWVNNGNPNDHGFLCRTNGFHYFACSGSSRGIHNRNCGNTACLTNKAPVPQVAPAPAPAPIPTQTVRVTRQPVPLAQSPSQTPSQPVQTPPASPPQQSCTAPTVHFKTWTVGGPEGHVTAKNTSFITNTETTCKVKAEVTYDGSQSPTTCEITSATWTVTMGHGFTVDTSTVDTDSPGEGFSKVWKYEATLTGPEMRLVNKCDHNLRGPDLEDKPDYPGRNQQRMWITIRFTGTYSGGTLSKSITLNQDVIDGIRQEYVDYGRKLIPKHTDYTRNATSIYNWGHYHHLIDKSLASKHLAWAKWCNRSFTKSDLIVKSGYRHPYHNTYCVGATATHGPHQYGFALDIGGKIVYKNGKVDLSKTSLPDANGDGNITSDDRRLMEAAAQNAGAPYTRKYPSGHVHADWRTTQWFNHVTNLRATVREMNSGDYQSATSAPTPPSNNGGSGGSGGSGDSGDSGDTAPAAPAAPSVSPPPTTTPTTPTTVRCGNRWRGPGRCSSGGRASSRTAHESTCGAGHTYWNCNRTAVAWHATSHTCTRSGCGQTYTNCSKGNGSCSARRPGGGTYQWHD